MSTDPTKRVADAYATSTEQHSLDAHRAKAYRPEDDAEADRLAAQLDKLPATTRLAVGYHQSAREAAQRLENQE